MKRIRIIILSNDFQGVCSAYLWSLFLPPYVIPSSSLFLSQTPTLFLFLFLSLSLSSYFCFSLSQSQSLIIWLSRLFSLSLSLSCSFYLSLFLSLSHSSSPSHPTSLSVSIFLSLSWSLIGNDQGTPFQRVSGLFQDFDGQVTQVKSGDVAFLRNIIICLWFFSIHDFLSLHFWNLPEDYPLKLCVWIFYTCFTFVYFKPSYAIFIYSTLLYPTVYYHGVPYHNHP